VETSIRVVIVESRLPRAGPDRKLKQVVKIHRRALSFYPWSSVYARRQICRFLASRRKR
jgi:hypothetical protein